MWPVYCNCHLTINWILPLLPTLCTAHFLHSLHITLKYISCTRTSCIVSWKLMLTLKYFYHLSYRFRQCRDFAENGQINAISLLVSKVVLGLPDVVKHCLITGIQFGIGNDSPIDLCVWPTVITVNADVVRQGQCLALPRERLKLKTQIFHV